MDYVSLLFLMTSHTFNLPPGLLSSVCYVESGHEVAAIHFNDGGSDSLGICQIKEATAAFVGFKGSAASLHSPKNNVYFAGKYLHHQLIRYNGDILRAVSAYNAGSHRVNKQGLTYNRKYVSKVFKAWANNR